MVRSVAFFVLTVFCVWSATLQAQPRKAVEKSTDVLMFAPSAAGLAATLVLKDYKGTGQLALGAATSLATTLLIKYTVSKERPDGSDDHSFPSNHTAVAFQGASFIQRRYGWKYGLPAYVVSTYVAWGRVFARKHDCWDVLVGPFNGGRPPIQQDHDDRGAGATHGLNQLLLVPL